MAGAQGEEGGSPAGPGEAHEAVEGAAQGEEAAETRPVTAWSPGPLTDGRAGKSAGTPMARPTRVGRAIGGLL